MSGTLKLLPKNKYAWIRVIDEDQKVAGGLLYAPGNVDKQYRLAEVLGIDSDCQESKGVSVGDKILYDALGAVSHRMGNSTYTTVKVVNILAVIETSEDA